MDQVSNELNKLRIDRSQRGEVQRSGKGEWVAALVILALIGATAAYALWVRPRTVEVTTVRPRLESSNEAPVLVATGYVIAHHKIQVGSKIAGRVAWIGVDKGDRVAKDQIVVRLEDREYRAQYDQAVASVGAAQARLMNSRAGRALRKLIAPAPTSSARKPSSARMRQTSNGLRILSARA